MFHFMRRLKTYAERAAWLEACAPPRAGWAARSCSDVRRTLHALGTGPEGLRRVLDFLAAWPEEGQPPALCDVCEGFRVGASPLGEADRFSGRPIGVCGRFAILVWPKTESDARRRT